MQSHGWSGRSQLLHYRANYYQRHVCQGREVKDARLLLLRYSSWKVSHDLPKYMEQ